MRVGTHLHDLPAPYDRPRRIDGARHGDASVGRDGQHIDDKWRVVARRELVRVVLHERHVVDLRCVAVVVSGKSRERNDALARLRDEDKPVELRHLVVCGPVSAGGEWGEFRIAAHVRRRSAVLDLKDVHGRGDPAFVPTPVDKGQVVVSGLGNVEALLGGKPGIAEVQRIHAQGVRRLAIGVEADPRHGKS